MGRRKGVSDFRRRGANGDAGAEVARQQGAIPGRRGIFYRLCAGVIAATASWLRLAR